MLEAALDEVAVHLRAGFQRAIASEHGWWTSYVHELRHLLLLHAHGELALLVLVETRLWSDGILRGCESIAYPSILCMCERLKDYGETEVWYSDKAWMNLSVATTKLQD